MNQDKRVEERRTDFEYRYNISVTLPAEGVPVGRSRFSPWVGIMERHPALNHLSVGISSFTCWSFSIWRTKSGTEPFVLTAALESELIQTTQADLSISKDNWCIEIHKDVPERTDPRKMPMWVMTKMQYEKRHGP